MTQSELLKNLTYQFPSLSPLEHQLLTQTVTSLSLVELKALRCQFNEHSLMKQVIDYAIKQWESEAELTYLEDQHNLWDDYSHCCGRW